MFSKFKYVAWYIFLFTVYIVGVPLALMARGLEWILDGIDKLADEINANIDKLK